MGFNAEVEAIRLLKRQARDALGRSLRARVAKAAPAVEAPPADETLQPEQEATLMEAYGAESAG